MTLYACPVDATNAVRVGDVSEKSEAFRPVSSGAREVPSRARSLGADISGSPEAFGRVSPDAVGVPSAAGGRTADI